jgi:hypothetical protein
MDGPLTVRFYETDEYDLYLDEEFVRLMATTSGGTFYSEVPSDSTLGPNRRKFREKVLELMQEGLDRGEVDLGD